MGQVSSVQKRPAIASATKASGRKLAGARNDSRNSCQRIVGRTTSIHSAVKTETAVVDHGSEAAASAG